MTFLFQLLPVISEVLALSVFKESEGQRRKKVSNGLQNKPRQIYTLK
jgi:hypothetical protein